ncbi:MAG: nucleotidyl transferase AbiEii/AbiGii toxin family protein [Gammaproteobacteria bacterium]|nr:nucleotidyl transferase AbiEii/AbiGii toxin family protein [Gammaproteobacteria bacterium]MCY4340979.1 nucleotidyl transferase AbiEii/AbiGii toxin family protein [Gammaproteobacteria bacterium]
MKGSFPRISFTAEQQALISDLELLARAHTGANGLLLKGGTALLLGWGLPRPSSDLDFCCAGGFAGGKAKLLEGCANTLMMMGRNNVEFDIKQKGRGKGRLAYSDGSYDFRVAVDLQLNDETANPVGAKPRRGVLMPPLHQLAESKLQTLIGENPRMKARDLYDAAWLLSTHPNAISGGTKRKMRQALPRFIEELDVWAEEFECDFVMSNHDPATFIDIIDSCVQLRRGGWSG